MATNIIELQISLYDTPSLRMARAICSFVRSWTNGVPIVEQVLPSGHAQLTGHQVGESFCRDEPVGERWREIYGYSADLSILRSVVSTWLHI
jgi:hypothetical protein